MPKKWKCRNTGDNVSPALLVLLVVRGVSPARLQSIEKMHKNNQNHMFRSAIIMYGTEFGLELLNICGSRSGSCADPEFPSLIYSTFLLIFLILE
jgi:hypothetical protein